MTGKPIEDSALNGEINDFVISFKYSCIVGGVSKLLTIERTINQLVYYPISRGIGQLVMFMKTVHGLVGKTGIK